MASTPPTVVVNVETESATNFASLEPTSVVVIHPGSLNLRIGKASDTSPITIPHVIARRNKSRNNLIPCQEDPYLIPAAKIDKDSAKQINETLLAVANTLTTFSTENGIQRVTLAKDRIFEQNKKAKAVVLPKTVPPAHQWTSFDGKPDTIVGESVLLLKPTEPYHVRWPIRRGLLNVHEGVGGSLLSAISDLEAIWSYAITKLLHIPLSDLKNYKAVLVIPDVYVRNQVKELINLLLKNLGFESCFIQHEAICATFGAGLSVATVIDIGDQKTSICCVEDGSSSRTTRITLEFGGSDITQLFHYLLKQRGFPYSELKSESRIGGLLLQSLKHEFCHLDPAISGTRLKQFQVSIPEQPQLQYNMLISDECIHAPLALFHPELFCVTGNKTRITLRRVEN